MTKIVTQECIEDVIKAIQDEQVVAFPTETVYGLGVKFGSVKALNKLMEAKNRDYSKAITLMVAHKEDIERYAIVSEKARKLIDAFMPGMITLVFKKRAGVHDAMTFGKETIGIRIPDSPFVLSLLEKTGPMLVTSANLSHHSNTTTTQEVLDQLDGRIDMVVEGKTFDNVASSVVDVSEEDIKILRVGKITDKEIKEALK